MLQTWTCECGHRWSAAGTPGRCPVCRSSGVREPVAASDQTSILPGGQASAASEQTVDQTLLRRSLPPPPLAEGPTLRDPGLARSAFGQASMDDTLPPPTLPPSLQPTNLAVTKPTYQPPPGVQSADLSGTFQTVTGGRPAPVSVDQETLRKGESESTWERSSERARPTVQGYEIFSVLGRGGMGVVYKARHLKLNRIVALKMVLSGGHAGPEELARFQTEAEAVARLQHPNIVQIYEIGEHNGLPFFSLEFVAGGSLQQRLDGTPMSPRVAAETVIALARAMDYAHQRGIVHRDLKPANILLAAEDQEDRENQERNKRTPLSSTSVSSRSSASHRPKITDFGLAKRLEGASGQTGSGSILGTPSYMAPEQALGKNREVGPPADIYSLGAILYDMLTGRPPFKGETVLDTLQQVQGTEPLPPTRLQPKVPRDLEIICLKCLQKDAGKRYASAGALADDLRRFLDHKPIEARPTPWWERAAKWAQRRPAVAALLAVLAVTLVTGFCALFVLWRQAVAEQVAAENARDETEKQRRAAVKAEGEKEQQRLAAVAARVEAEKQREEKELQRKAAEKARGGEEKQRLEVEKQRDRGDKNLQAAFRAGEVLLTRVSQEKLLLVPRMEKVRKDLLLKAKEFYESFLATEGATPVVRFQAGQAQRRVGDIDEMLGQYGSARASYEKAIVLLQGLAEELPAHEDYRFKLAGAHNNHGVVLQALNQPAAAEAEYRSAVALLDKLQTDSPQEPAYPRELAVVWTNLAGLLQHTPARSAESSSAYLKAVGLWRQAHAANLTNQETRFKLAKALANYATFLLPTRPDEAEKLSAEALDLVHDLTSQVPDMPAYLSEQAHIQGNLAVLWERKDRVKAEATYRAALGVLEPLVGDFPNTADFRHELARIHTNLSLFLARNKKAPEAAKERAQALVHWKKLVEDAPHRAEFHNGLVSSLVDEAVSQWGAKETGKAVELMQEALKRRADQTAAFPGRPDFQVQLAGLHNNLGQMYGGLRDFPKEEEQYTLAVKVLQKVQAEFAEVPVEWYQAMADAHANQANVWLSERKDLESGLPVLKKAVDYQRAALAKDPANLAARYKLLNGSMMLVNVCVEQGEYASASETAKELEPLLKETKGLKGQELFTIARLIARCLPKADGEAKKRYADQVVRLLEGAVGQGYRNAEGLRDPLFNPVRERMDFGRLVSELEKK